MSKYHFLHLQVDFFTGRVSKHFINFSGSRPYRFPRSSSPLVYNNLLLKNQLCSLLFSREGANNAKSSFEDIASFHRLSRSVAEVRKESSNEFDDDSCFIFLDSPKSLAAIKLSLPFDSFENRHASLGPSKTDSDFLHSAVTVTLADLGFERTSVEGSSSANLIKRELPNWREGVYFGGYAWLPIQTILVFL